MKISRRSILYRTLCIGCAVLVIISIVPWNAAAMQPLHSGVATAEEAASFVSPVSEAPASNSFFSTAQPDSVVPAGGYFEEEEENKNLYRDIGVFLIVSAFAGYFIIKVFLEGETEEIPVDDGGKVVPDPLSFKLIF